MSVARAKTQRIVEFWAWFQDARSKIESLYEQGNFEALNSLVSSALDAVEPMLAWEIGPGKGTCYSLTISAEGNPELRGIVDATVEGAPKVPTWEFNRFKQPRPAPRAINLPERRLRVRTGKWQFIADEDRALGRIHVTVLDDQLARMDKGAALRAVSLFLDALLGEEAVEEWLGEIRVSPRADARTKTKIHHISRLPDYILWATHREKNPISKVGSR
jgi:hypothetical protein